MYVIYLWGSMLWIILLANSPQFSTYTVCSGYQGRTSWGMHPPQYFSRGDDNAFIIPNIGRNYYAIAVNIQCQVTVGRRNGNQRAIAVSALLRLSR